LRYAIPQISIEELVCLNHEEDSKGLECADNQELFRLRDTLIPIVRVSEVLNRNVKFSKETNIDIINKFHINPTKEIKQIKRTYFAVVNVKGERFGLIVDKVYGTEEIVVKPMHSELKTHEIYSGATVMGDGSVALILNIEGISKHANISKFLNSVIENKIVTNTTQNQMKKVLLFKNGEKEQFAIDMSLIQRIEKIKTSKIEFVGSNEFINIDNNSLQIIRLEKYLNVSIMNNCIDAFLLLPKNSSKPVGILISQVLDIVEVSENLNKDVFVQKGIFGTSIIKEKLTLFMDVNGLLC
jgi:two-component system chemotaxis sensor kinase CheA